MKLSPSEEYGLRCILQLAKQRDGELATVVDIAEQEGMSTAYVEKLLLLLKKAGLVESVRGASGGYKLSKPAELTTVGSVLRALDGSILDELCERFPGEQHECVHLKQCNIRPVWVVLTHHVQKILDQISLADLLQSAGEKNVRRELYQRFPLASLSV